MNPIARDLIIAEIERQKLSVAEVARRADVPYDAVRDLKRGKALTTSWERASRIAEALGIFLDSPGPMAGASVPDTSAPTDTLISVYDVSAAAGDGMVVDEYEAVVTRLAFPPDYLRHITTTAPEHLAIISVTGGSMTPTLHHDDVVMVDATKRNIAYDGMFVLRHEGLLKVKRLRWGPGRASIILISDNEKEHPPEDVPPGEVEIVGRVVWVGAKKP